MMSVGLIQEKFLMVDWAVYWLMWANIIVMMSMTADMVWCGIEIVVWNSRVVDIAVSEMVAVAAEIAMVWDFMMHRCVVYVNMDILEVWHGMMDISMAEEFCTVVSVVSEEELVVFLGVNSGNNCADKECSHLIRVRLKVKILL